MGCKSNVEQMNTESAIEKTLLLCWAWLVQISIGEKTQNSPVHKLTHYGLYKDGKHSESNDYIINLDFILHFFRQELSSSSSTKFSSNVSNESITRDLARHTENLFKQNSILIQVLYGLIYGILMYRDTPIPTTISQNAESPKREVIQLYFHQTYEEKETHFDSDSLEIESTPTIPGVVYLQPTQRKSSQCSYSQLLVKNQPLPQLLLLLQECIFSDGIPCLEKNCFFFIVVNLLTSLCASFNILLPHAQQVFITKVIPWILSGVANKSLLWNHPLIEGKLELIFLHILSYIDSSSLLYNSNLTIVHSFCLTLLNCSPYETNTESGELTKTGDGATILRWLATGEVCTQKVDRQVDMAAWHEQDVKKCNNCLHNPCLFQNKSKSDITLHDFSTGASLRVLLVVLIFSKTLMWSALDSVSLDNIFSLSGPISTNNTPNSQNTSHSESTPTVSEDVFFGRHLAIEIALKIWFFQMEIFPSVIDQNDSYVFRIPLCFLLGRKLLSCLSNVFRIKNFSCIITSLSSACSSSVWNFLNVLWSIEDYNLRIAQSFPSKDNVIKNLEVIGCYEGHVLQWIRRSFQYNGENLQILSTSFSRQYSNSEFYNEAFLQTLSLTENNSKGVSFLLKEMYSQINLSAVIWTFQPLFEVVLWMVSPDTINHVSCLSSQKSIKSAAEMFKWFVFDKYTTSKIHSTTLSKFSSILEVVFSIKDFSASTESLSKMHLSSQILDEDEKIDKGKNAINQRTKAHSDIKNTINVVNDQIAEDNFYNKLISQLSFITGTSLIEITRQFVLTAFLYVTIQNQTAVGRVLHTVIEHWCYKHYSFSLFIIETNCYFSCKSNESQGSMSKGNKENKMINSTPLASKKDTISNTLLKQLAQNQVDKNTFNQLLESIDDCTTASTGFNRSLTTISILTRSLSYFCVPSQEFLLFKSSNLIIRGFYFYFKLEGFLQNIFYKKNHTRLSLNYSTGSTPYIIGKWLWDCISYQPSTSISNSQSPNLSTISSNARITSFKHNTYPSQDSLSHLITSDDKKKKSTLFESRTGIIIVHPLLTVLLHSMSSFLNLFLTESKCYVLSSTCLEWIEFTFFQLKLHMLKSQNIESETGTTTENMSSWIFDINDVAILLEWLALLDIGENNERDVVKDVMLLSNKITPKIKTYYAILCQRTLIGRLLIMSGVEPQLLLYGLSNEIETVQLGKTSNFAFSVYKRNNLQSGFQGVLSSTESLLFPLLGRQILETNLCFSCPPFRTKESPVSNLLLWIIGQAFKTVFFSFPLLLQGTSTNELIFDDN